MSIQHDPDVIVGAWLADGPTDLPDDLERSIAIATRAMPQSRGRITRLARRIEMTRFQTLGLVAAVAIAAVVGLVALSTFRGDGSGVGGQPSPSPTPAPTTAATQAPPVLSETFNSPWYGYTIDYPSGWDLATATVFHDPLRPGSDGFTELDLLYPTTSDGTFHAGSAAIPEDATADQLMQAYWESQSDLQDITIDGQPALLKVGDVESQAAVTAGDRVYFFSLSKGPGGDGRPPTENHQAIFEAMLASVRLLPDDAVSESEAALPALTQTWTSPSFGFSMRYPADWQAVQGTQAIFDPVAFGAAGGPSDWMDVLGPPDGNGLLRVASAQISPGGTPESLIEDFWGLQPASLLEDITVAGNPAKLKDGSGELEAVVTVGDRVYFLTFFEGVAGEQRGMGNGRALFEAVLASMEFHPEDAAVASPAP